MGKSAVLEEAPDELDGTQPKRINVFLKDDLVSPLTERKSSPDQESSWSAVLLKFSNFAHGRRIYKI